MSTHCTKKIKWKDIGLLNCIDNSDLEHYTYTVPETLYVPNPQYRCMFF